VLEAYLRIYVGISDEVIISLFITSTYFGVDSRECDCLEYLLVELAVSCGIRTEKKNSTSPFLS
jgi:hypothetical protein